MGNQMDKSILRVKNQNDGYKNTPKQGGFFEYPEGLETMATRISPLVQAGHYLI